MTLVTVEFLRPYADRGGARFNARERAGLPPAVAEDLAARGVARIVPPKPSKAPEAPPKDKMARPGWRKGKPL